MKGGAMLLLPIGVLALSALGGSAQHCTVPGGLKIDSGAYEQAKLDCVSDPAVRRVAEVDPVATTAVERSLWAVGGGVGPLSPTCPSPSQLAGNDDGSTDFINFSTSFKFLGGVYPGVFVNNNGILTFMSPFSTFTPYDLGTLPAVAPYWADVDTRGCGTLKYCQTTDAGVLTAVADTIGNGQTVAWAFIATWDEVGYFNMACDKRNSFQTILAKLGDGSSVVVFNYGNIEWTTGDASEGSGGRGGIPAVVGFSNGDNSTTQLGTSHTPAIVDVEEGSNVNVPGRYVFSVSGASVVEPCSGNTVSTTGFPPCTACPTGFIANGQHTNCNPLTSAPTATPSSAPTSMPTVPPTKLPSASPTPRTPEPTSTPTSLPTSALTSMPTRAPTVQRTAKPTKAPTVQWTPQPTKLPTTSPALGNATAVAASTYHTCALLSDGSVTCWGMNSSGQLGDGTAKTRRSPVSVSLGAAATAVAAGGHHTCALLSGGSVRCWGWNGYGELGDGTTTSRYTPVSVVSLGGAATAVTAGAYHTCALLSDGSVRCWGRNWHGGQLGDGTMTNRLLPVSVISLGGAATAVTAGYLHTCALLSGGSVKCWGANGDGGLEGYGQLGDGTTGMIYRLSPVSVISLGGAATAVAAGKFHTCALLSGGSVKCWGANLDGELGDGTTYYGSSVPVSVISLGGAATAVTTGALYTCALLSGGSVRCWGYNDSGQLGDGTTTKRLTPVSVVSLGGAATAVTAGDSHTCALLSGGSVRCWGYNSNRQLGDGTTTTRLRPVTVVAAPTSSPTPEPTPSPTLELTSTPTSMPTSIAAGNATAVAAGYYHTCALLSGGSVKCWGYNNYGELGDGTTTTRLTPVSVISLGGAATAVAAGNLHTCALLSDGSVKCWGYNNDGQLGDGTTTTRLTPVSVISLGGAATAVTTGYQHTCALLSGGSVKCWGGNAGGELGDGTFTTRLLPVSVISLGGAATAVTARGYTCALLRDGSVKCWGYSWLGDGTTTTRTSPVSVISLGGAATAVSAGAAHTCALLRDGSVRCWGYNEYGVLGDGTTTTRLSPVSVISLGDAATAVAAGTDHTCALLSGGSVECWGGNAGGELGDGTFTTRLLPVPVSSLGGVATAVTTGDVHTCALLSDGSVRCWGWNDDGQLGDGTTNWSWTPVTVSGL